MIDIQRKILGDIASERDKQDAKWGPQSHQDGTGDPAMKAIADYAKKRCDQLFSEGKGTWGAILEEETREAFAESSPDLLRKELIQVAAVCVAWIEDLDRRQT